MAAATSPVDLWTAYRPTTSRVGTEDYSPAPLTEPDVRFTHPALWLDISELQR